MGDITQITTANFAARYHDPLIVGLDAVAALWAVSGLAVFVGPKVGGRIPQRSAGAAAPSGVGRIVAVRHKFPYGPYRIRSCVDRSVPAILYELVLAADPGVL